MVMLMRLVLGSGEDVMSGSAGIDVGVLVLCRFLGSWFWWPRTVAMDFGRCFVIRWVVSPGKKRR